jgi:hypothetical protein
LEFDQHLFAKGYIGSFPWVFFLFEIFKLLYFVIVFSTRWFYILLPFIVVIGSLECDSQFLPSFCCLFFPICASVYLTIFLCLALCVCAYEFWFFQDSVFLYLKRELLYIGYLSISSLQVSLIFFFMFVKTVLWFSFAFYVVLSSRFLGRIVRSDGFGLGIECYLLASLLRGDPISFLFFLLVSHICCINMSMLI